MKRPALLHVASLLTSLVTTFIAAAPACSATDDIFIRTSPEGSVELSNVPTEHGFNLFMSSPTALGKTAASEASAQGKPSSDAKILAATWLARVEPYRKLVDEAARLTRVDARLLHAVIAVESGYNPKVVSNKGAVGLMQLMPDTVLRYSVENASDPQKNILGGASYLRDLLKMFNNDVSLALAAYNAGENAVLRYGSRIPPYRETAAYVPRVLAMYQRLEKLPI